MIPRSRDAAAADRRSIEKEYYDRTAGRAATQRADLCLHGPAAIEAHLRAPYLAYRQAIESLSFPGAIVLDLGAGTGVHSFLAPASVRAVIATDISLASLAVAQARARALERVTLLAVADGEELPLRDDAADVCTSAGVLYCLDVARVAEEVARILSPEGAWVIVDSFNHSPVYRLNRLVGYLRGKRTHRAFTSIPNAATLDVIRSRFREVSVSYFGVWTFLWPVLRVLVGARRATALLGRFEPPSVLRRLAFKIVVVARFPLS